MRRSFFTIVMLATLVVAGCQHRSEIPQATIDNTKPIAGQSHFVDGFEPVDDQNNIQVVIEIPTGTTAKWEVDKSDGKLHWEMKNGKPRIVNYVGYPGNYGMIPRTLLPKEAGGDGDPLDVLVLGPPLERGSVVTAKLIGMLKLLDGGEQDDKLIAVMSGTPFYAVDSIAELDREFNGVTTIITTWFSNYKGPGEMEAKGFSNTDEARKFLDSAIAAYK